MRAMSLCRLMIDRNPPIAQEPQKNYKKQIWRFLVRSGSGGQRCLNGARLGFRVRLDRICGLGVCLGGIRSRLCSSIEAALPVTSQHEGRREPNSWVVLFLLGSIIEA